MFTFVGLKLQRIVTDVKLGTKECLSFVNTNIDFSFSRSLCEYIVILYVLL